MSAPRRTPRIRVDGVVLLDKPHGMSSNNALQTVRRLYMAEKAGHTGTLDPMATGLLAVCLGEATKFSSELLGADKRYLATVQLGLTTDTADAEGRPLIRRPIAINRDQVLATLNRFQGDITQIPPMHSALKRNGKPLYSYARQGVDVERSPRQVRIHSLTLLELRDEAIDIDVSCSKGTYIRTLAEDIGEALGCGGHLSSLRRVSAGPLSIKDARSLAEFEVFNPEQRMAALLPVDYLLHSLTMTPVPQEIASRLRQGQSVPWPGIPGARLRLYDPSAKFMGTGRITTDEKLQPERLVANLPA